MVRSMCRRDANIRNNLTVGFRHGIAVNGHRNHGKWDSWRNAIVDNHVLDARDTGILLGFYSYYSQIRGNRVERAACHGIDIFNVSYVVVTDNVVHNRCTRESQPRKVANGGGIFIHTDWCVSTAIPVRNVLATGNQLKFDLPNDQITDAIVFCVIGYAENVNISANQVTGGSIALRLREVPKNEWYKKREDQRESPTDMPQHIRFSDNLCVGQWDCSFDVIGSDAMAASIN